MTHAGYSRLLSIGELDLVSTDSELVLLGGDDWSAPVELGRIDAPGGVFAMAAEGDLAIVATGSDSVLAIDLSDPGEPGLFGTYLPDLGESEVAGVAMAADRAYLMIDDGRLEILDISAPGELDLLGSWDTGADSGPGVAAGGDGVVYAACAKWEPYQDVEWWIEVLDASDPETVIQTDSLWIGSAVRLPWPRVSPPLVRTGDKLLATGWNGIKAWDVTDPRHPVKRWTSSLSHMFGRVAGITATDSLAAIHWHAHNEVVDSSGVALWWLSDGRELGGWKEDRERNDIVLSISAAGERITLVENEQPIRVRRLAMERSGRWIRHLPASASHGAVVDEASSTLYAHSAQVDSLLVAVDLSNPRDPWVVGEIGVPGVPYWDRLAAGGSRLAASSANRVYVFDLEHPWTPRHRSTIELDHNIYGLAVGSSDARPGLERRGNGSRIGRRSGTYLHSAGKTEVFGFGDLAVNTTDITAPAAPRLIAAGVLSGEYSPSDLVASGAIAIVSGAIGPYGYESFFVSWKPDHDGGVSFGRERRYDYSHNADLVHDGFFVSINYSAMRFEIESDGTLTYVHTEWPLRHGVKYFGAASGVEEGSYSLAHIDVFGEHCLVELIEPSNERFRNRGALIELPKCWPKVELRPLNEALIIWGVDDTLRVVNADLPRPPVEVGQWRDGELRPVRDRMD
ncbi:MAG: hypothetical protein CME06_14265 [Gemmatimonadetes bacterium]|nr:hypothetical protein [Gemmatimonadota bacterium]